jgi:hypothetical protein
MDFFVLRGIICGGGIGVWEIGYEDIDVCFGWIDEIYSMFI